MTDTIDAIDADRALKARHRTMWALGDYPAVATQLIPAALAGADVVAADLTPELLATGRELAAEAGAELMWEVGDAEGLPYADGTFDVVLSSVGVMFAQRHQQAADELVRVCRPGGTIGLISWTPEGSVGELFRTMKPYAPAPPPGAQPPPLWGDEDYVRGLLGERVTDVVAWRQTVTVDEFRTPEEWRDFWKTAYGPTIVAYRTIGDDPERVTALDHDHDLAAIASRYDRGARGTSTAPWRRPCAPSGGTGSR